jgi:GDPmannose 4,6-dehydratase
MATVRRALIFGITGQDGCYLAEHLLALGYEVHGTSRAPVPSAGNLHRLGILGRVRLHAVSTQSAASVKAVIETIAPTEIYNLAGQSSVRLSFSDPVEAIASNLGGTLNILEAIRCLRSDARFYNASSSEALGEIASTPPEEHIVFRPKTPYGVAKASSTMLVQSFREAFGLFACSGVMFSHESPLRPAEFLTQRITRGAIDIAQRRAERLQLENLRIVRDWGWAPDFVRTMPMMLQRSSPEDFVIATGVPTSLEAFVERVFSSFGLAWKDYVTSNDELKRPTDISVSFGNPKRAQQRLGWTAGVRMPEVADRLVEAALAKSPR